MQQYHTPQRVSRFQFPLCLCTVLDGVLTMNLRAEPRLADALTVALPNVSEIRGEIGIAALDLSSSLKQKAQRRNAHAVAGGVAAGY